MSAEAIPILSLEDHRRVQLQTTAAPAPPRRTVPDIVELYCRELQLRHDAGQMKPRSFERSVYYCRHFAGDYPRLDPAQPKIFVEEGSKSDLTRWLLLHPTWKEDSTKLNAIRCVHACFHWAEDEGLIPKNPFKKPKHLRLQPKPRIPIYLDEYLALDQACRRKTGQRSLPGRRELRYALRFLWGSSARTCEMRELEWEEMDWQNGVIVTTKHKTFAVTGQPKVIAMTDQIWRLLAFLYRHRRPGQKQIFVNSRGKPWTKDSFARTFRNYANRAGLPKHKSAYCLRHGFSTEGTEAGISTRGIADALGHVNTRMVDWYSRQTRQRFEHLRNVVNEVERSRQKRRKGEGRG